MSKHTLAPWIAEDNLLSGSIDIVSEEREFIVSIYPDTDTELAKIDKANAKLIAAAPELLEACINALKDIQNINKHLIAEGKHGYILMENELNNAIKKATL